MKPTERQRGTQLLELAVVLPLLALLVLIICEGAALIRLHQVLNNAAREGARISAMGPEMDCQGNAACLTAIRQAVVTYAANNGITMPAGNIAIENPVFILTPDGTYIRGSRVAVTYDVTLNYLPRLPFSTVPLVITLTGAAEFANLY